MTTDYYARIDATYEGGNKIFSIPFPYINKEHITVFINDRQTKNFIFNTLSQIVINDNLTTGDIVSIRRTTPINERMVVFSDTSILNETTQNLAQEQTFDAVQEIYDNNITFQLDIDEQINSIDNKVDNANSTANTALTNSQTAVSTANSANTKSDSAVTTANSANTKADTAVSTSQTALTNSQTAMNTADSAILTANSASDKVDEFGEDIEIVKAAAKDIEELNENLAEAKTAAKQATNAANQATTAANQATQSASAISSHISNKSNPHSVTKAQVGLGNVDNTSDLNKPISTATQSALALKADKTTLHALKGYSDEGELLTDSEGLADVKSYAHSTFDLSKFTVVGSPVITDEGVASGFSNKTSYLYIQKIRETSTDLVTDFDIIISVEIPADTSLLANRFMVLGQKTINHATPQFEIHNNKITLAIDNEGSWVTNSVNIDMSVYANQNIKIKCSLHNQKSYIYLNDVLLKSIDVPLGCRWDDYMSIGSDIDWNSDVSFNGSIDLKSFSITVDGVEVFSGNKTGIDTIKPEDYTVTGSPTISDAGIASGFSNSNYINSISSISFVAGQTWEIQEKVNLKSTKQGVFFQIFDGINSHNSLQCEISGTGTIFWTCPTEPSGAADNRFMAYRSTLNFNNYLNQDIYLKWIYNGTQYICAWSFDGVTYTQEIASSSTSQFTGTGVVRLGWRYGNTYGLDGSIDLNSFKIYIDGNLVYQPCLKIPYTQSKTGSKIVDAAYRDCVEDMYSQFGYAPYYTLQEGEKENFTVVGSPTIVDGVASGFGANNYLVCNGTFDFSKPFKIAINEITFSSINASVGILYLLGADNATATISMNWGDFRCAFNDGAKSVSATTSQGVNPNITYKYIVEYDGTNLTITRGNVNFATATVDLSTLDMTKFQSTTVWIGKHVWNGTNIGAIDLKQFSITVDGEVVYTPYIQPNFTLPMGEVYGMIENAKIKGYLGEVKFSLDPIFDDGLHLLDGSLLQGDGVYKPFIDSYIKPLYSKYPNRFISEEGWQTSVSNYGVCGYWVYDETANTVRLPKVTGFVEGTLDVDALGVLTEAGLPNIAGTLTNIDAGNRTPAATGAFTLSSTATDHGRGTTDATFGNFSFSAQNSNPIYGNSSTVQPQSIKGYLYIVLANNVTSAVSINQSGVVTELNGKADKDQIIGEWVFINTNVIAGTTFNASQQVTYDLSNILPNDGHTYDCIFSCFIRTGSTSNDAVGCALSNNAQGENFIRICRTVTRTSGNAAAQGTGILPIDANRVVTWFNIDSVNTSGACGMSLVAYRKLGY